MRFEPNDLLIILIVAILIFCSSRIPELARAVGKAIREFKDAVAREGDKENEDEEKSLKESEKK